MATLELEVEDQSELNLRSPLRKLVKFFRRSRNRWKAKCAARKHEHKLLSNQVRAVHKSREKWKQDAKQAQQQVLALQRELEQYKKSAS